MDYMCPVCEQSAASVPDLPARLPNGCRCSTNFLSSKKEPLPVCNTCLGLGLPRAACIGREVRRFSGLLFLVGLKDERGHASACEGFR